MEVICMKILLVFMSIFLFGIVQAVPVSASTTLTVNCENILRPVNHNASGSLYGITETLPTDIDNLVAPLKPYVFTNPARAGDQYQQPIGAAIPTAGRITGTTGKVMIRLADICPKWPYVFPGMNSWLKNVNSVIADKKASGYSNFYGYEIWNEPIYTWSNVNGTFNDMWKKTYKMIRSKDPGAKIIGPSEGYYDHDRMKDFLTYCQNNNSLPDIISWHELGANGKGIEMVSGNIDDYRALETSLGISERLISINEYCDPDHNKEGAPGPSARYIAKFERKRVDSACISWWWTANPGRLGSLLATDTAKGGGWWFYYWYGQMTGNMVNVTPPQDASVLVDGFACVDSSAKYISTLFGGNNDGTINVTIKNIPSFIGSTAHVVVEKAKWTPRNREVNDTNIISQSNYTVSNNEIVVSVAECNNYDGYRIYITPATGN